MTKQAQRSLGYALIFTLVVVLIQVMIGGTTRLTGSGLSITKWDIVTGSLPPMSADSWNIEFDKYKETPQFIKLNHLMTLSEFKYIYFWEWFHRFWGRWGFVLLFGIFLYYLFRHKMDRKNVMRFITLLVLYALQGLLGWFMVKSGLIDNPYVSHYRLTAHLLLAIFLFAYILWFAVQMLVPEESKLQQTGLKKTAWWITALIIFQIMLGGFMSGLRAAVHYPSWPDMNGQMIPENLFSRSPLFMNFLENITMIQFMHRGTAYLLFAILMWYFWKARKFSGDSLFAKTLPSLPALLVIQVVLGILVLLNSTNGIPVFFGVAHQAVGLLLLSSMLFLNFQLKD